MINHVLADVLYYFHLVVLFVILSPYFLPAGDWLKFVVIFISLILMDWQDGDEQCSVTAVEAKLRGTWRPGYRDDDDAPEFTRPLLNKLVAPLGLHVTKPQGLVINYLLVIGSGLVAFIRFALIKNISLVPKDTASKAVCAIMGLSILCYIVNMNYKVPV